MNKKFLLPIIILIGAATFFLLRKASSKISPGEISSLGQSVVTSPEKTAIGNRLEEEVAVDSLGDSGKRARKQVQFIPQNEEEENMHRVNQKLRQVFENKEDPRELISFFEQEKLVPEISASSNQYTGTMMMIRTQRSMAGVRYFHAQYMGDDPKHVFLQHFSYEFKPGPKSLQRAVESAESAFALTHKQVQRGGDFITYDIGDEGRYQLSIEKASWERLKDDPFSAHLKEDEGTIITRIELKVHVNDENHSEHIVQ